jgi:hypothetical protein
MTDQYLHVWRALPLVFLTALPASAANVTVGTCIPNRVSFDSLADAVQGVPAGSTIQVCPGTYPEQIAINKSLTIKGVTTGDNAAPVITVPASGLVASAVGFAVPRSFVGAGTPIAAQVAIGPGADVTITDVAVDAAGAGSQCTPIVSILAQDSSVTLNRLAIRNQTQGTCYRAGVLVQNDTANPTTVKVQNSSFRRSSQAIEIDGAVTSTIANNSLDGEPTSNANAISILIGNATIHGNTISNYNFPAAATVFDASYGVYICGAMDGSIANNTIAGTQVGVLVNNNCPTSGVSVTNNKISFSSLIGIYAGGTAGVVQGNDIRTSSTGIRLPGGSSGNTIQGNLINDACTAFSFNPAAGVNSFLSNTLANVLHQSIVNATALCP